MQYALCTKWWWTEGKGVNEENILIIWYPLRSMFYILRPLWINTCYVFKFRQSNTFRFPLTRKLIMSDCTYIYYCSYFYDPSIICIYKTKHLSNLSENHLFFQLEQYSKFDREDWAWDKCYMNPFLKQADEVY